MASRLSPGSLWPQPPLEVADARMVVSSVMARSLFGGIVPGDLPAGEEIGLKEALIAEVGCFACKRSEVQVPSSPPKIWSMTRGMSTARSISCDDQDLC